MTDPLDWNIYLQVHLVDVYGNLQVNLPYMDLMGDEALKLLCSKSFDT